MNKNGMMRFWTILMTCLLLSGFAIGALQARENRGVAPVVVRDKEGQQVGLYQESHALVIGVAGYRNDNGDGWPELPGVREDVKIVARALEDNGFHVQTVLDPKSDELEKAFEGFIRRYGRGPENRLLFYFAGHGHTVRPGWSKDPMGYIAPADAPNPERDPAGFEALALPMQRIEEYAIRIHAKHALFLFDSCFSGSLFGINRAIPENISYKTEKPVRQFITAGAEEETVPDRSIFRRQFVAALAGEGDMNGDGFLTGAELGLFLQEKVIKYSNGAQHPQYGKIRNPDLDKGDFVFRVGVRVIEVSSNPALELEFWKSIKDSRNPVLYRAYLEEFPNGVFAAIAKAKIRAGFGERNEPRPKTGRIIVRSNVSGDTVFIDGKPMGPTGPDAHALAPGEHEIRVEKAGFEPFETRLELAAGGEGTVRAHLRPKTTAIEPEMVRIEGGCFQMGSPASEKGRYGNERQHRVCVEGFRLAKYEVTVAEFRRFARATDYRTEAEEGKGCHIYAGGSWNRKDWANWKKPGEGQSNRDRDPARCVSWNDALAYLDWLNRETGADYRLPTEAEWEFAARAGTTTRYYWGDGEEDACVYANGYDAAGKRKYDFQWTALSCNDGYPNVAPVGSFRANGYGLFDMSGNVWEWTCSLYKLDYDGSEKHCVSKGVDGKRVVRGDGWISTPRNIRSAIRIGNDTNVAYYHLGFRLAREF
uniref:Formylglycine-generating enzyme, required for sulfatase activity, contains SUMF1/FGE domain n=1 Tax=Candidatus Kentrum sp. TC TaxID=2126339 RepID=A0A451A568_9GAMM|nr:MAG: Formylglycine-generating enzyme, required for sulfatase activity, contains SUMF1/FGE domain [Candidatus Kentron sp. TC]